MKTGSEQGRIISLRVLLLGLAVVIIISVLCGIIRLFTNSLLTLGLIPITSGVAFFCGMLLSQSKKKTPSDESPTSMDGFWLLDMEGRILEVNETYCRMSGYCAEEVLAMRIPDLDVSETMENALMHLQRVRELGEDRFESQHHHKNGEIYDVEISVYFRDVGQGYCESYLRDVTVQKKTERALRENEELFSLFMRHSPIYAYIKEVSPTQSRVLQASENFEQMIGIPGSQMIGKTMEELFPPEFAKTITADDLDVITRGEVLKQEEVLNERSYTTIKFPILRQKKTLLAGYTIDITERHQAEQELLYEQLLMNTLLDSMPGIFFLYSYPDLRLIRWNKNHETLLGFGPDEIKDRLLVDWHPVERREAVIQSVDRIMREGHHGIETSLVKKDGTLIPFILTGVKLELAGRLYLIGVGIDITERTRAEEELRESREQLSLALDVGNAGIWEWDTTSNQVRFDARFHAMLGYEPGELPNTIEEWAAYHHPEDTATLWSKTAAYLKGTLPAYESEHRIRSKTGTWSWIFTRGQLVKRNVQGGSKVFMGIAMNITERKQAEEEKIRLEEQLQQSQKLESVGRLAGGVAHDFNNMLGAIIGYAEIALEQLDSSQPLYSDLKEIHSAANRSADLTRQLLAFARKQTVDPKVLNLNNTVGGLLRMLKRLIGEDIDLIWQPTADPWPIKMDPSQVDQILANLCVNARDAIINTGIITIKTGNISFDEEYCADHSDAFPGDFVLLSVSDTGTGMDKETLPHIFEPFFTTKGIGVGTGLGLSTVYGAVKQNNGFINLYSEPGMGTTISIYLPRYHGMTEHMRTEEATSSVMRGHETVLLVEDELTILKLTTRFLEKLGYCVLATSTPQKALRLAQDHKGEIHLLMTDVIMPTMNGWDLAQKLQALHPHLRCLFMSGYTADVITQHGILNEGVHFIQKPFSIKPLAAKLREVLDSM